MTDLDDGGVAHVVVSGPPSLIGALRTAFSADPEVTVEGEGGPPTARDRLHLRLPRARATALSAALGTAVHIEPNDPLVPPTPASPALDWPSNWHRPRS